jgi:hypothetical protein
MDCPRRFSEGIIPASRCNRRARKNNKPVQYNGLSRRRPRLCAAENRLKFYAGAEQFLAVVELSLLQEGKMGRAERVGVLSDEVQETNDRAGSLASLDQFGMARSVAKLPSHVM